MNWEYFPLERMNGHQSDKKTAQKRYRVHVKSAFVLAAIDQPLPDVWLSDHGSHFQSVLVHELRIVEFNEVSSL